MTLTATATATNITSENQQLVLRAFAALRAPLPVDVSELYAEDAEFLGPGQGLWTGAAQAGAVAGSCFEIERIEAEDERVVTHATLRPAPGREARCLFVHSIAGGRITKVWSLARWS